MSLDKSQLTLILILFAGLLLRIFDLGGESIWLDEACSIQYANWNFSRIISLKDGGNVPLYYIVLHGWVKLFGDSEFWIRFPSVIFGFFSLLMIYKTGRILFNKEIGILSSLLLALSSFHIYYSQEARTYSLTVLLTLVSMYFFIMLLNKRNIYVSMGYILSSILLLYSHVFGLFIIISQNIYFIALNLLSKKNHEISFRRWVLYQASLFILFTPWIKTLIITTAKVHRHTWRSVPTIWSIGGSLLSFSGSNLLLIFFVLLSLLSFITVQWSGGYTNHENSVVLFENYRWKIALTHLKAVLFLLVWLITPIIFPFIISQFSTPIYHKRYTIVASLAFYLLISKGISGIRNNYAKTIIIGLVILLSSINIGKYYSEIKKEQWREVANYIDTRAENGDLILFNAGFTKVPYDYYSKRTDVIKKPFPGKNTYHVNEENIKELRETVRDHNRVWLVFSFSLDKKKLIKKTIIQYYDELDHQKFKGIIVFLYQKNKNSSW